ncbi:unnamed protein product [Sphenostylis stenocarpa]|uniref:Uncharacterized protein n=1 Tax=Sphenostylis stenocarpa TaxID=92480 RepID=A0AA86THP4_9FABA|nr:unnamed protein product [Sphenostylis stenocarpa]
MPPLARLLGEPPFPSSSHSVEPQVTKVPMRSAMVLAKLIHGGNDEEVDRMGLRSGQWL